MIDQSERSREIQLFLGYSHHWSERDRKRERERERESNVWIYRRKILSVYIDNRGVYVGSMGKIFV